MPLLTLLLFCNLSPHDAKCYNSVFQVVGSLLIRLWAKLRKNQIAEGAAFSSWWRMGDFVWKCVCNCDLMVETQSSIVCNFCSKPYTATMHEIPKGRNWYWKVGDGVWSAAAALWPVRVERFDRRVTREWDDSLWRSSTDPTLSFTFSPLKKYVCLCTHPLR